MKRFLALISLVAIALISFAQKSNESDQNSIKDKLFIGFVTSYYLDFVSSPLKIIDMSRQLPDGSGGFIQTPDTAVPFQTRYISFISLGFEPRLNILEFDKEMALGIAMPITIGFGQAFPHNQDVAGAKGFGNIQVPILARMYFGTNSTYESTSELGISAGAGFEYNKLAIINTDGDNRIKDANRGWIMPTFSASVHFWRGSSPLEVNFKYGVGNIGSYRTNSQGSPLPDGERITRANSIKLSLNYLLDY